MKKLGVIFFFLIILLLVFFFKIYFYGDKEQNNNQLLNVTENPLVVWGKGWQQEKVDNPDSHKKIIYKSEIGGSEFSFKFKNSQKIIFSLDTSFKDSIVGIEGWLDKNYFVFSYPNLTPQKTTLAIRLRDVKKEHTIIGRVFCFTIPAKPCDFKIRSISLDSRATLLKTNKNKAKTYAVLGDSISGNYGNNNYTFLLANKLNYHLLNSSYAGSMMTKGIQDISTYSGLLRIKTEIIPYKPDILLVFLGTNDLGNNISLADFARDYEEAILQIKKELPETKVLAVGILSRSDFTTNQIVEYSEAIRNIAQRQGINYVDPYQWLNSSDFSDGLHPSLSAQKKLAEEFYAVLKKLNLINF